MPNLILFKPTILDQSSYALVTYLRLYKNDIINNPIIFSDYCAINIDSNIPIFNSYFLRQHFFNYSILLDFDDLEYLNNLQNNKCIILYNETLNDISDISDNHTTIPVTASNIDNLLRDKINEKV